MKKYFFKNTIKIRSITHLHQKSMVFKRKILNFQHRTSMRLM